MTKYEYESIVHNPTLNQIMNTKIPQSNNAKTILWTISKLAGTSKCELCWIKRQVSSNSISDTSAIFENFIGFYNAPYWRYNNLQCTI